MATYCLITVLVILSVGLHQPVSAAVCKSQTLDCRSSGVETSCKLNDKYDAVVLVQRFTQVSCKGNYRIEASRDRLIVINSCSAKFRVDQDCIQPTTAAPKSTGLSKSPTIASIVFSGLTFIVLIGVSN